MDTQTPQNEIKSLEKELEQLRSKTHIADLEEKIEHLKKENVNRQIPDDVSMTNLPGYEEEFARLKMDVIASQRKNKKNQIINAIQQVFITPIIGFAVYYAVNTEYFINFVELDEKMANNVSLGVIILFGFLCLQALFNLVKSFLINPEDISDQTLSYLSLTAKEHILDPKGSVIREKYGTGKWAAVTET